MPPALLTERPTILLPAPPEDATRREFITRSAAMAATVAFLAACGDDGGAESAPATHASRTVTTALGDVDIPTEVDRVAVLNVIALDAVLRSGVKPAAITDAPHRHLPTASRNSSTTRRSPTV